MTLHTTSIRRATRAPAAVAVATSAALLLTATGAAAPVSAQDELACDAEPVVMTAPDGVDFVRTPDACFTDLPDWPYEPNYVEIDGLRQAYVDEGPADGEVVLLLHGQPSWSYLYRDMIPVLADAGYRVIAMDHLGMGRSDKPVDIEDYSYLGHNERLQTFVEELELTDINLFVQDWGSLIGLRTAGLDPERYATIAVGDGMLPVIPEGFQPFPPVDDPDALTDLEFTGAQYAAQQVPFYDGCEPILDTDPAYFGDWMAYAMTAESFMPSVVVEAMTWFDLSPEEEAAYDAPFPSRVYMAGPRTFPSLINDVPGTTAEAWAGLTAYERPFLTLWASNDPGNLGSCEVQQRLIDNVPGAAGQPHDRLPEASHFLQDDQGTEIATRLVDWYASLEGGTVAAEAAVAEPVDVAAAADDPVELPGRYCEILLVNPSASGGFEAEVWGTQLISRCPDEAWQALDSNQIQADTGALAVVKNGPRVGLMDETVGSIFESPERQTFGDLEMRLLTTVVLDPALTATATQADTAYTEQTALRSTTFVYEAGSEIYELTSPAGDLYVMQSMSQIVDPDLLPSDLASLGERLDLPSGWTYAPRTLEEDLVLITNDDAIVVQDELQNSYQKVTADERAVGFEIMEITDDGIKAWASSELTQEEFDAIDLPAGWFKNQPREAAPAGGRFHGSPGADGVDVEAEHFGHEWFHSATVVGMGEQLDDEGLLTASTVEKDHEISFGPGATVTLLVSPDDERYVLVSRDAGRTTDQPTIPPGWELVEEPAPDGLTVRLDGQTTVIRADNEDSFQGPVMDAAPVSSRSLRTRFLVVALIHPTTAAAAASERAPAGTTNSEDQ